MWRSSHTNRNRRLEGLGRQLVIECESYLGGNYPSLLQDHGLPVPAWAWLSVLAHGTAQSLEARAVEERRRPDPDGTNWEGAVDLLAQELVTAATRAGCTVEDLQHSILRDLELEPDPSVFGSDGLGPGRLVEEVRRAIARFRGTSASR